MISLTQILRLIGVPMDAKGGTLAWTHQSARAVDDKLHGKSDSRTVLKSQIESLIQKNQQIEALSEAKTRFFAAVIHDLRQPLQALMLFSDALSDGEVDPTRLQRIDQVRQSIDLLERLFTGLLDLTQLDAGRMRAECRDLPLDPLFDEVRQNFQALAEAKGLRLMVRHTQACVHGDCMMLRRILSNLVSNSLRNTRSGGVIIGARRHEGGVRIDVYDTGIGIAPQHHARVFDEFYKVESKEPIARGEGLGIGLATVKRMADLQSAEVRLQSKPGRGTVVSVLLQRAQATNATALNPSRTTPLPATPRIALSVPM